MIKRLILVAVLLTLFTGCAGLGKTETSGLTGGITSSIVTSIWKVIPGYKRRRIIWLEFKVEEAQLQQTRQELRYEMKEIRNLYIERNIKRGKKVEEKKNKDNKDKG